ncbi:MAG: hypothetical protein KJ852_10725 [Gammaproteobacteria bacterium]|nr:hypothetical protein [Gammaproteobacteria bacterium]MBU0785297.1 hypothetical protein [Gammaproteobacteria bacterium]MBU0815880.1 hypothetical protein [Gammaproteobacteria bacterium]MBU1787419.1 hypothetical protein [Gammaproteobacteria bacterium]
MKNALLAITVCLTAVGCGTTTTNPSVAKTAASTFTITKLQTTGKSTAELDQANQKLLEEKLEEVLNFCLPRLSGYEQASVDQAKNAYWLSMSGLIAGSVLGPALTAANATSNASSIAALSGWAGATNFAGQSLKTSGLSGSSIAETRNAIIKNVKDAVAIASDGSKSFEDRSGALMRARSECIIYEIAVPSIPQAN